MKTLIQLSMLVASFVLQFSNTAKASVESDFALAKSLYESRGPIDQTQTLKIVDDLISKTTGPTLYEVRNLGAAAAWLQAKSQITNIEQKKSMLERGQNYANQAIKQFPNLSTGYMWRAFNTAEYALHESKFSAVLHGRVYQIKADLEQAMSLVTASGAPGESDNDFGPVRVLGKYYINLALIPGNYKLGMKLLNKASFSITITKWKILKFLRSKNLKILLTDSHISP